MLAAELCLPWYTHVHTAVNLAHTHKFTISWDCIQCLISTASVITKVWLLQYPGCHRELLQREVCVSVYLHEHRSPWSHGDHSCLAGDGGTLASRHDVTLGRNERNHLFTIETIKLIIHKMQIALRMRHKSFLLLC